MTKIDTINLRNAVDAKGMINSAGTISSMSVTDTKGLINTGGTMTCRV